MFNDSRVNGGALSDVDLLDILKSYALCCEIATPEQATALLPTAYKLLLQVLVPISTSGGGADAKVSVIVCELGARPRNTVLWESMPALICVKHANPTHWHTRGPGARAPTWKSSPPPGVPKFWTH